MPVAKVTSKGQITIPVTVRKKLGLSAGSCVSFAPFGETYILASQDVDPLDELEGFFSLTGPGCSVEDMNAAIKEKARKRFLNGE